MNQTSFVCKGCYYYRWILCYLLFSYSWTKLDIGKINNKNVKFVVSECINIYIQIELKFTNSITEIIIHQNTLNNNRYKTKKVEKNTRVKIAQYRNNYIINHKHAGKIRIKIKIN